MTTKTKPTQPVELKITFRFATAELLAKAKAKVSQRGGGMTAYLNELLRADLAEKKRR